MAFLTHRQRQLCTCYAILSEFHIFWFLRVPRRLAPIKTKYSSDNGA